MKAAEQFGWSKTELIANIAENAHENIVFAIEEGVCHIARQEEKQADSCEKMPIAVKKSDPAYYSESPKMVADLERRWVTMVHYTKGDIKKEVDCFHSMLM